MLGDGCFGMMGVSERTSLTVSSSSNGCADGRDFLEHFLLLLDLKTGEFGVAELVVVLTQQPIGIRI